MRLAFLATRQELHGKLHDPNRTRSPVTTPTGTGCFSFITHHLGAACLSASILSQPLLSHLSQRLLSATIRRLAFHRIDLLYKRVVSLSIRSLCCYRQGRAAGITRRPPGILHISCAMCRARTRARTPAQRTRGLQCTGIAVPAMPRTCSGALRAVSAALHQLHSQVQLLDVAAQPDQPRVLPITA